MNTVEMHNAIDLYLDRPRSTRYRSEDKDIALNIAIQNIVRDRYKNKKQTKGYTLQSTQDLRDELGTLITGPVSLPFVNDIAQRPSDYRHLLLVYSTVNGIKKPCSSTTYDAEGELDDNPFKEPVIEDPYYNEVSSGFRILYGKFGTLQDVEIYYVKEPQSVFRSTILVSAGALVLTIGSIYYVNAGPVIHNGVTYITGQTFTAVNQALTGAGSVFIIVNSDLPTLLHDEITKTAASIMAGNYDNIQKRATMERETGAS